MYKFHVFDSGAGMDEKQNGTFEIHRLWHCELLNYPDLWVEAGYSVLRTGQT